MGAFPSFTVTETKHWSPNPQLSTPKCYRNQEVIDIQTPGWFDQELCEEHSQELNPNPSDLPLVPSPLHYHTIQGPPLPGNRDEKCLPAFIIIEIRHLQGQHLLHVLFSMVGRQSTDTGEKHKLWLVAAKFLPVVLQSQAKGLADFCPFSVWKQCPSPR